MSENLQKWIKNIASISGNEDFQNKVAQIMSKSLLKEITDSVPEYKWTYLESQIVKNAVSLSFMIRNIAYEKPEEINIVKQAVLRLASLWENLARLKEKTDPKLALINAAVAYEIAGYQANAYCLARKISRDITDESSIESLTCLFLQRQFLKLKQLCEQIIQIQKKMPFNDGESAVYALSIASTAHGFLRSSEYFLNGDEELLRNAEISFNGAIELLTKLARIEEATLIQNIQQLLPITKIRSTWHSFDSYEGNPLWNRYLKLLARGIGADLLESSSISEIWPSQKDAIDSGLFDSERNKVIKMPTSAGKTRIAEFAIVDTLIKFPNSKCVYVAPYRALVSELEDSFLNLFGDLGFRVSSIVGNYEFDPFEDEYITKADILVTTPEKLDFLLRSDSSFLESVRLFILDEGHMINNGDRGIKLEFLLNRLKKKLIKARFIFISAVLSDKTVSQYIQWLNSKQSDFIKSEWRPSISQHAKFEWIQKVGKITYESRPENKLMSTFVSGIINQKKYRVKDEDGQIKTKPFPDVNNKAHTCAELAFKFSELGPVLVFAPQRDRVISVAKALQRRLDYTKQVDERMPTHFVDVSCRSTVIATQILGDSHLITKLLKSGIGVHYGDLPEQLRRAIELDFRDKEFKVIIATNTLAQGVNLPIRTVIIHSCRRGNEETRQVERVSVNDYWNIAGRAGRAGQETEGTVIHITITASDKQDYDYYLRNKMELSSTHGALFQLLDELLHNRLSDVSLREKIDAEILALLAEENYETIEEFIDEMLDNSLVTFQAEKADDVLILKSAIKKIVGMMKSEITDQSYLKTYSSTGFSSQSCLQLKKFIEENGETIKDQITNSTPEKMFQLLSVIVDELSKLREMEIDSTYDGDKHELLQNWLIGSEIGDLSKSKDSQDSMDVVNFIEDFCGYTLPWGVSAFLKIAQQVLQIEKNTIPNEIKYLSSMVKYGVPNPESCWCMMIGIPFKSLAIRIASDYTSQRLYPNFDDFFTWISNIDNEVLRDRYKLSSPFLEDVTKAISRASINPLLDEKNTINEILEKPTPVKGIGYKNSRKNIANLVKDGDEVHLARDYENGSDRNAIKIFYKGNELGYIERNLAQLLAPDIDCGLSLNGVISKKEIRNSIPYIQLILKQ